METFNYKNPKSTCRVLYPSKLTESSKWNVLHSEQNYKIRKFSKIGRIQSDIIFWKKFYAAQPRPILKRQAFTFEAHTHYFPWDFVCYATGIKTNMAFSFNNFTTLYRYYTCTKSIHTAHKVQVDYATTSSCTWSYSNTTLFIQISVKQWTKILHKVLRLYSSNAKHFLLIRTQFLAAYR